MGDELQTRYERLCRYSDYLDDLQRSAQRYYLLALAGLVGTVVAVFGHVHDTKPLVSLVVGVSGGVLLFPFGLLTLAQLASLRALNLRVDSRIKRLDRILDSAISTAHPESSYRPSEEDDERTQPWTFGNDWAKAAAVSLGNTAILAAALLPAIPMPESGWGRSLFIPLLLGLTLCFDLHLVFYNRIWVRRLAIEAVHELDGTDQVAAAHEEKHPSSATRLPSSLEGTFFLRFLRMRKGTRSPDRRWRLKWPTTAWTATFHTARTRCETRVTLSVRRSPHHPR